MCIHMDIKVKANFELAKNILKLFNGCSGRGKLEQEKGVKTE